MYLVPCPASPFPPTQGVCFLYLDQGSPVALKHSWTWRKESFMEICINNYNVYLLASFQKHVLLVFLAELWATLASQFYVFLLFMSLTVLSFPSKLLFLGAPFLPPCAAVCKCLGSVVRELTSWVYLCPGSDPHVDLLSLCHSHLGTCPGWDNMHDLIYSKESALNQETAYLVKFSRPSKTQESWTLKCLSLCEFRFIEEF